MPDRDEAARFAGCRDAAQDTSLPAGVRANAYAALAEIEAARGRQTEALKDYDTAIALDRKDTAAVLARGRLFEMMGHDDEAAADYTTVLAMENASAEAFARRGALRLKSTNPTVVANALADLVQAHRLDSRDVAITRMLGTAQLRTDHDEEAAVTFSAILTALPDDHDSLRGRATAYGRLKRWDDAIADLDHVLRLQPDDLEAWKTRGVAALQADRFENAVADFTQVLARQPENAETQFFRATARFRAGDIPGAEADFDTVLRRRPKDPDALAGRGLARLTGGRLAEAEADFSAALAAAPHAGLLRADRGRLRVLRGDDAGAATDLAAAMTTPAASIDVAVWQYIAMRRADGNGTEALAAARARFADAPWPLPVARYFLGEITASDLSAKAETPLQACEASYALGQAALLRSDRTEAMRQFTAATATSVRGSLAYIGAKIELAKLAGQ